MNQVLYESVDNIPVPLTLTLLELETLLSVLNSTKDLIFSAAGKDIEVKDLDNLLSKATKAHIATWNRVENETRNQMA